MELNEIRKKIDRIDDNIIMLLDERMSLMPYIAEYKLEKGLDITDDDREKQMISNIKTMLKNLNLRPDFIERIFTEIMSESKKVQSNYIGTRKK